MIWDQRSGTEIIARYPEEIKVTDRTLMQVYSTHEYSGESGLISVMVGPLNIASYYTGAENAFYLLLLLDIDDDADTYEGGIADAARVVYQAYQDDELKEVVPVVFQRLSLYPSLNEEQLLAITYNDEVKRMILNRLREEGVVTKSELKVWLKDIYKKATIDVDTVLVDLIKRDLIKEASVKGMPSELVFLTNDLIIIRRPPTQILSNPSEKGLPDYLTDDYRTTVRNFFQNYQITEDDSLKIAEILINNQAYLVLKLLRTAIVTKNTILKLRKKGLEDTDDILRLLWENQIIQVFQDKKGTEYYSLMADYDVSLVFPKYSLNIIKKEYEVKSKSNLVLMEYLNVLEDSYLDMRANRKKMKTKE